MPYRYEIYNERGFKIFEATGYKPQMDTDFPDGEFYHGGLYDPICRPVFQQTPDILIRFTPKREEGKEYYGKWYKDPLEGYTAAEIEAAEKFNPKRLQEIQAVIKHEKSDETLDHND